ncbi:rRNA maturation RNase YbeY [Halomonas aquamarina]|mgnify:FL=1|jgi:probable rRNA maturation factor|uniref:Endoribonuclease YbeY n=1 Tax=Vreelandella aquamarina TaxID=77097 RepID=A0A1H8MYP0_9GAMM|nr:MULTISPECIES: rRNA maturation RNase YbeY [Halomonas]HAV46159.1 rRNA maturation RNase YbeY [Halomonas sp.]MCD1651697.1 rRNA maturation RNase YbeY [Halomonas axialensis]MCD2087895.1 rRNA maturation RNase YbeY [Halomonas meridiana]MDC8443031.1 rRNA maturation RNase YbeY [Halomonas aquamarina]SEO22358.1 probable rRNA maturation factor [Halomonas aquamarina]|tara:strand:- start:1 stop:462 length:462 start_codon:yes stop_codon:yes gene_type:complete
MSDIIIDRQAAIDEPLLPSLEQLTHWVGCVFSRHPDDDRLELTIRFVDEEESQALNRDYREKDKPTNVLSFPFENPPGITLPLLGDLIICHAVVAREAEEQQKPLAHHYAHIVVHGTLHLMGYDHIEEQEAEEMEQLERELLATLNIPDPYHV